jgi:Lanthionine-containing peptide SapB precursor RamS
MSLLDLQGIKSPKGRGGKGDSDDCGDWTGTSGLSLLIC